jgi:hypothetical protein
VRHFSTDGNYDETALSITKLVQKAHRNVIIIENALNHIISGYPKMDASGHVIGDVKLPYDERRNPTFYQLTHGDFALLLFAFIKARRG